MTGEGSPRKRPRRGSVCVGCGSHITDQFILRVAPDLEWHAACLKCADCNQYLDETCTCFVRDGKTYCKADYARLFGAKCPTCNAGFCRNDFVMRARNRVFHVECFRCVACSRQLVPGDEFALRDDGLFCKADHEVVERSLIGSDMDIPYTTTNLNNNNTSTPNHNSSGSENDGIVDCDEIKKTKCSGKTAGKDGRSFRKSEHKTTRIRTVLNEKQLHTLRTCYGANPRPDALMKEQLVEMTALSPRVIRVWFQNKRCKDKKRSIYLKQMHQQQEKNGGRPGGGSLNGVPMVAASPVRHDSHIQPNPVEVQPYQPPWKALSDFAMQSELDHPPFQQLMHTFDMGDSNDGYPTTPTGMHHSHHHPYMGVPPEDMPHHPHSVSSEFSGAISDMSSPISQ